MHKHTVAVDLDGVLSKYDGWKGPNHFGDPIPGAKEFLTELRTFARVLIYTVRCCADKATNPDLDDRKETPEYLRELVRHWLVTNELPFDDIYIGQGKPLYSVIIDDRAIQCRPQENTAAFVQSLPEIKRLCGLAH